MLHIGNVDLNRMEGITDLVKALRGNFNIFKTLASIHLVIERNIVL